MNLGQIIFPVYVLGSQKPNTQDNVVFYASSHEKVETENVVKIRIVDDRNLPQLTLAGRRLALKEKKVTLHSISKAVFFLGDLIKLADSKKWFIDSSGQIFDYKKQKRVPLVFKPIQSIIPLKTGGALVEVKHVGSRFKILLAPTGREQYAGLLQVGAGYILYGLYEEQQADTFRMI